MIARVLLTLALCAAITSADDEPLRFGSLAWRHAGSVTGVAFVDGGARVVTSSLDGTCVERDAETGVVVGDVGGRGRSVVGLSAGDDGARLAVMIHDGDDEAGDPRLSTVVYDRRGEDLVEPLHVDGTGALSADGRRLAHRRSGERRVTVVDVESREVVATLDVGIEGDEEPRWFALSEDGATLFVGGRRASSQRDVSTWLGVYSVDAGRADRVAFEGSPAAFALGPGGRSAAAALADGRVMVVSSDGDLAATYTLDGPAVTALALVDDARLVTAGSNGVSLRVADPRGETVAVWTRPLRMAATGLVVDLTVGRVVPFGRSSDVAVFSLADGRPTSAPRRHPGRVTAVDVASGDDVVATGGWAGELMLWDTATAARLAAIDTGVGVVTGLGFLGDVDRFVVATGREGRLVVVDREADAEIVAEQALGTPILAMDVAPDGRRLATGHRDGVVRVWTWAGDGTLEVVASAAVDGRHVTSLAWAPDGARLAVVATSVVCSVDAESLEVVARHDPRCPISDVSHAGARIAIGLATRTARVLDAATLEQVFATPRLASRVETVALSPDGMRLAVASIGTAEVRVYDAGGEDAVPVVLEGHDEDVACLEWARERLVSGSADGTAVSWHP